MSEETQRGYGSLVNGGIVLIGLQLAIFAKLCIDTGFDRATDGFPILILCTALLVAELRRLSTRPPNRGAARWLIASRTVALALLAFGTVAVGFFRLVPKMAPAPDFVIQASFALMWATISLKGAAMGKLKPGSAMGLCVSWTRQSRLAWDRGHRTLGRVLFWGGLIGLGTSLSVTPLITVALWFGTIFVAVVLALLESWRSWRIDPERTGGHAA
jgi:uncharacterized membrane protein